MADNVAITPGAGATIATDDVAGVQYQRVKLDIGADGASAPVTAANPLPVALDAPSLAALESIGVNNFPATQPVSLAAPVALDSATLTALENITVQSSALPTGASTEATLAALSAKNPALGAAASAAARPVVLATDDAQIGTKVTAVTALAAGGTGLIGWLSSIWNAITTQLPATLGIKAAAASLSVAPASDAVFAVAPLAAATTDRSGAIAAGGTAQQLAAANAARRGFWVQNNSAGPLWITTLTTAVQSQPSLQLIAGAYYESPQGGAGTGAISIIGATTAQAFSAREW